MQPDDQTPPKPEVIILDVYETILDMTDVERKVNHLFDMGRGYVMWFELFMQYCFVDNCIGQFHDFATLAKATMQMTGRRLGRTVDEGAIDDVIETLKHLPLHEYVREGLSQLNDQGYRIVALTNSPERVVSERMEPSGLISYFELVLSAEQIKKYKPALEVYGWAAKKLGVEKQKALVVTAHGWDLAGAANAGMQTAYIKHGRDLLYPLAPEPTYTCGHLLDLAEQLQARFGEAKSKSE